MVGEVVTELREIHSHVTHVIAQVNISFNIKTKPAWEKYLHNTRNKKKYTVLVEVGKIFI